MPEPTCNGYRNWDTFVLVTQISNDIHLYHEIELKVREHHDTEDVERMVRDFECYIQEQEPELNFDNVDWSEVLEALKPE